MNLSKVSDVDGGVFLTSVIITVLHNEPKVSDVDGGVFLTSEVITMLHSEPVVSTGIYNLWSF